MGKKKIVWRMTSPFGTGWEPYVQKQWYHKWQAIAFYVAAGIGLLMMVGCDTINYHDPHAGCTEVWVLEGFRWDEKQEAWVVKPGHRPKKLIWKQRWDCDD